MATNFKGNGDVLTIVAPYDVDSGDGCQRGLIFGVAQTDADSGDSVAIVRNGIWELAKTSAQAWAVGDAIYWDNINKVCTTASSTNQKVGVAYATAANPSSVGTVLLDGMMS